jgi:hypothetical protein
MNDDDDVPELEDPSDDSDGPPPLEYSSGDEGSDDVVGALVGALASVRLRNGDRTSSHPILRS